MAELPAGAVCEFPVAMRTQRVKGAPRNQCPAPLKAAGILLGEEGPATALRRPAGGLGSSGGKRSKWELIGQRDATVPELVTHLKPQDG